MAQNVKNIDYAQRIIGFAKYFSKVSEEIATGLLGFIPNGLEQIYDNVLKRLPLLGKVFSHRWVEQAIKLCCGVTIGQGLASDIGRFIFKPIGFCIGALMGTGAITNRSIPVYQGQIRKFLYKLSNFTVSGALIGFIAASLLFLIIPSLSNYSLFHVALVGGGCGAGIGVLAYFMYLVALTFVMMNQTQTFRHNVHVAKGLGIKLKQYARQNAKGRIMVHAQDIIQQMNGSESQPHLAKFFENEFENISQTTNKKIERHFNYLTERACHGDNQALNRLQMLTKKKSELNKLLDRVFNSRAIAKIKDEVDTYYDRWYYQFLKM